METLIIEVKGIFFPAQYNRQRREDFFVDQDGQSLMPDCGPPDENESLAQSFRERTT